MHRAALLLVAGMLGASSALAQGFVVDLDVGAPRLGRELEWRDLVAIPGGGLLAVGSFEPTRPDATIIQLAPDGSLDAVSEIPGMDVHALRVSAGAAVVVGPTSAPGVALAKVGGAAWAQHFATGAPVRVAMDVGPTGTLSLAWSDGGVRVVDVAADGTVSGGIRFAGGGTPCVAALPDGSLAVALRDVAGRGAVVRLDAARNVAWELSAGPAGCDGGGTGPAGIAAQADGSVDVACTDATGSRVVRLRPDGSVAWQLELPAGRRPDAIAATTDGATLVAGRSGSPGYEEVPWVARLAADGSAIGWLRELGDAGLRGPAGELALAQAPAGGAAIAFAQRESRTSETLPSIAVLDAAGNAAGACSFVRPSSAASSTASLTWAFTGGPPITGAPPATPSVVSLGPATVVALPRCSALACEADAGEPDDADGSATTILGPGDVAVRNSCDDADDWFLVRGCAGTPVTLTTSALGPASDTVIEAWTMDGTLLASDDDGGGAPASRLVFVPPETAAYRMRVTQVAGPGPGTEYTLTRGPEPCVHESWEVGNLPRDGFGTQHHVVGAAAGIAVMAQDEADASGGALTMRTTPGGGMAPLRTVAPPPGWDEGLATALLPRPAGGLVTVGVARRDVAGVEERMAWIVALDAADAPAWTATFPIDPAAVTSFEAAAWPDGSVLVAVDPGGTASGAIVKLDAAGAVAWTLQLDPAYEVSSLDGATDGGAIAWVTGPSGHVLLRIAADGSVTWAGALVTGAPPRAVELASGRIASVQSTAASAVELSLIEADGTLAWSGVMSTADAVAPRLTEAHDGTLLLEGGDGGWLGIVSQDGELRWWRERPTDVRFVNATAALRDAAGVARAGRFRVMRLDALGAVDAACDAGDLHRARFIPSSPDFRPGAAMGSPLPLSAQAATSNVLPRRGTWIQACSTLPCAPMDLSITAPANACAGVPVQLEADVAGGHSGLGDIEWDLAYDGLSFDVDAVGPIASATFPAAGVDVTVAARVTDLCAPPQSAGDAVTIQVDVQPSFTLEQRCEGDRVRITAIPADCPGCSFRWNLGPDASSIVVLSGSLVTLDITSASGCTASGSVTALDCQSPPSEVPRTLRAAEAAGGLVTIAFEPVPTGLAYNVLGAALGQWIPGAVAACHVVAWTDPGDGTLLLDAAVPGGSWFVVTASNLGGEGPAGADSMGREMSARPGWVGCGPGP